MHMQDKSKKKIKCQDQGCMLDYDVGIINLLCVLSFFQCWQWFVWLQMSSSMDWINQYKIKLS